MLVSPQDQTLLPHSNNSSANPLELLFFGDIVGKPGRLAVSTYLHRLKVAEMFPDVVIANIENVTHGFGLNERHYKELVAAGIDGMTSGNHHWDRPETLGFMEQAENLFRPGNFPGTLPGKGLGVIEVRGVKIGIINLLGQVFMGNYNSPWDVIDQELPALKDQTPIWFMDFHAETTAEKMTMGRYVSTLGISAFCGTHTHVQTADARLMNGRMGYVTDAGFNGTFNSVIGMDGECSLKRMKTGLPTRMEIKDEPVVQVNAIRYTIDKSSGTCLAIQPVNELLTVTG